MKNQNVSQLTPGSSTLELVDLDVEVSGKQVCSSVNLSVTEGEIHVLFGPNGSGKSSLLASIMGLPGYRVSRGGIKFGGQHIDQLPLDQRARMGLGMAFQRPPSFNGVSVAALTDSLGSGEIFDSEAAALDLVGFEHRDINNGFSGGEIKRWETLKLFLQQPRFCLFDEPESGVDLEHIAAVGDAINRLVQGTNADGSKRSALIITHTGFILDYVAADIGHMMQDGKIVHSAPARELFEHIKTHGYRLPQAG